jgi:replicative DNA helicase
MHVTRVRERLVAMRQRTSIDELRREKATDPNAGEPAAESDAPALRTFLPGSTVDSLVNEIRTDFDLDLVVVDHLHSLATMARPLDEELADSVRRLKAAALEAQVALLLVVSGGADSAVAGARPALAHFGALGAVRQHADVILGIYREEMYESTRGIDGATEVHVLKNRHGKTGYVDLYFYKEWLRFEDMLE